MNYAEAIKRSVKKAQHMAAYLHNISVACRDNGEPSAAALYQGMAAEYVAIHLALRGVTEAA